MKVYLLLYAIPYEGSNVISIYANKADACKARDEWEAYNLHEAYCNILQWHRINSELTEEDRVQQLIRLYEYYGPTLGWNVCSLEDIGAEAELHHCTTRKQIADWIIKQDYQRIFYENYFVVEKEVL